MANASSDHHPNHVPGMLIIIKPKQPNLPICSATSINLLLHLFSKPSLHLIAKIILGIIMTAIIISPNIFNQSIYSSVNPDLSMSYYTINLPVFQSQSRNQLGKKRRRIFACGEDSPPCAWLRTVNANRRICGRRKCPAKPCHLSQNKGHPSDAPCFGWGGRIRTDECQSQSLVPYRLATPQFMDLYPNSIPQIRLRVKTFPLFFRFFAFFAAQ